LSLVSFVIISCNGQSSKNIKNVDAMAFSKLIQTTTNPQILDVRTPEEFATDHINNAQNINWLGSDFTAKTNSLDKSKPVYVYCKIGGRSQQAVEKLSELGFKEIVQLEGGFLKWEAAGLSKPTSKKIGISQKEYAELLNSDKKVLVDFYAEWCAPCKKMTPYLLKMEKEMADQVVIIRLDADKNKSLLSEMKISELPTLLLYENKQIKWQHSGYISEADLKKQL
jgi:thioredoxin